jgi:hypothetical protein
MLSVITTLEFFQHHFAKMGHRNTSCDPHLHPSHQATNAPLPHAQRPPPGGYVLNAVTGKVLVLQRSGYATSQESYLWHTLATEKNLVWIWLDDMSRTREQILESRRRIKEENGVLFDSVSSLLYRHDPIGINFQDNADEYDLEAETILPRLRNCQTLEDVHKAVYAEFVRWFDADTAGPPEHYQLIAVEIWQLWQEYLARTRGS